MNRSCPATRAQSRDVLILTASTGGGHDSVAVALQESLHELAPEASVRIFDPFAGRLGHGPLSPGRWYDALVAYLPWLWGLVYRATNNSGVIRLGMAVGALLWTRRLRFALQIERPRIIVAVHPLCAHLAASILRTVPDAPRLHCVVTDLVTIHRCWACAAVQAFYVATVESRDALIAMGIPPGRVQLTGLPVRANFARAPSVPAGGVPSRVLVLGGGCPSHRIEKVVRALVASRLPLRLVVVCGRNTRLQRRLTHVAGARVTVVGWCDDVAALVRWSSVVITRGGPTTLVEALSQARPVVIYQVLPGQEEGNIALVERTGAGCYIPDVAALVRAVAARPCSWPTGNVAQSTWWGGAGQRVAARLLTARAAERAPVGSNSGLHPLVTRLRPRAALSLAEDGEQVPYPCVVDDVAGT